MATIKKIKSYIAIGPHVKAGNTPIDVAGYSSTKPAMTEGLCNYCRICWMLCPDGAVTLNDSKKCVSVNYDLCKGCGICAYECKQKVFHMIDVPRKKSKTRH